LFTLLAIYLVLKEEYMSILRFSDGINIDTSGPIRKMSLKDGWYVVGMGMLVEILPHH